MSKRFRPNQKKAHRAFTSTALKTNPRNLPATMMRGGYRI